MLIKIVCSSCKSDKVVLDESVFICKNIECDDFNSFFEVHDIIKYGNWEMVSGMTETISYVNEDDKVTEEVIKNGMVISSK